MLAAMDYEARVANPCIGRERADLVLAGCAILEAIRRRWPCERLRVADRGLREGVLVELMAEDGVWRPRSGRRSGAPPWLNGAESGGRRATEGPRQDGEAAGRPARRAGSSASSTIPTSRAPRPRAIAPARPTS